MNLEIIRLISFLFRIIGFVSAYSCSPRTIRLGLTYKLISALLCIRKTKTHNFHIYPNRHKRSYSKLCFKLSYGMEYTIQNSLVVNNDQNKILKGSFPFISLLVSGIRDGLDHWSESSGLKVTWEEYFLGHEFLRSHFFPSSFSPV